MKMALYRIFGLLLILTGFAHAEELVNQPQTTESASSQRIYVSPEQITFSEKGIFFHQNNSWVKTNAIFHDNKGMFITSFDNEWSWYWTCPNCGYEDNTGWDRECRECGYRG